jgi:hypothetical protein
MGPIKSFQLADQCRGKQALFTLTAHQPIITRGALGLREPTQTSYHGRILDIQLERKGRVDPNFAERAARRQRRLGKPDPADDLLVKVTPSSGCS